MSTQEEVISRGLEGDSLFITGPAGVGKSYVVDKIKEGLPRNSCVLAAPTGISALNIGGTTCHRLFSLPIGIPTNKDYTRIPSRMYELFGTGNPAKTLIIDELPMLRTDYFEMIDYKLKKIRNSDELFGGLQVITVGDFYQLEPIVTKKESKAFYQDFTSPFCFSSEYWNLPTMEMTKVYRQSDAKQVALLNCLRTKSKHWKVAIQRLSEITKEYEEDDPDTLHLCCYKEDSDRINKKWFRRVVGIEKKYYASISSKWEDPPVDKEITLKINCNVLLCANDPDGQFVNGDRGVVVGFGDDCVLVKLLNGSEVVVNKVTWDKHSYATQNGELVKEVEGSFVQIPIRLGYALTIHKVQGLTLDNVALDIGKGCFANGQLYCALSRIRNLENMSLASKIHRQDLKVSGEVTRFYSEGKL